ncbi:YdcF family protein [Acetobacter sacchari]|uniref:YdcF family protein n=1 Tax=Acetobacter sacchari TaxID=2661687 RepID=A0ABS3M0I0_9PROT|nr:YdcF family protein [Acetobacter sacchari]MBO1361687.1 YdcF family protein [Acetobacter sacchari]
MKKIPLKTRKPASFFVGISFALLVFALAGAYMTIKTRENKFSYYHDVRLQKLQEAIFPRLSAIMADTAWKKEVFFTPSMVALSQERRQRLGDSSTCTPQPLCIIRSWAISEHERTVFGKILQKIPRGSRLKYDEKQWDLDVDAINYILSVYGEGKDPHYPKIDAASVDVSAKDFFDLVIGMQAKVLSGSFQQGDASQPFFKDVIMSALFFLDANDRMDAIRFSELWSDWNAPALDFAHHISWKRYPYTAIIVPGEGPEDVRTQLSALGKFRLTLAVESFNQGLAPFIIVSGGAVHPAHTNFVEAVEMRRFLIEHFNIPARRIVTEPYARHTTTNLRNASRTLQILGAPEDRPAVIVTDRAQSDYISSSTFSDRNMNELKCEPGKISERLSPFLTIFVPNKECNKTDPWDPLDP